MPRWVLNAVKAGKCAHGYTADGGEYGDMLKEGVYAPQRPRSRVSLLGHLIAIEIMIAEAPKDDSMRASAEPRRRGRNGRDAYVRSGNGDRQTFNV